MRLFVAIDLSAEIRAEITALQNKLLGLGNNLKLIPAENLHLTLQFLGECEQARVPEITQALQRIALRCNSFELELSGSGCFPNPRRPRILWIGFKDQQDQLQNCVELLAAELATLGFAPEERAFSAHITVARLAERADAVQVMDLFSKLSPRALKYKILYLALYQSVLRQRGALYTCLHRANLKELPQ